ncbi:MAG: hypothetical protein AB1598_01690 [Thermodesulfobacteriota bacterium]
MKDVLLVLSALLLLVPAYPAFAQYEDSEPGGEETMPEEESQSTGQGSGEPVVIEQQPYEYYYWPEENLDNFGLSTLGQGQGGSTLGRSLQRKSNIEVNAPKEPPTQEGDKDGETGAAQEEEDTELFPPDETGNESVSVDEAPPESPKESEFYEWVDDKGNVHITNNLGDVPLEHQKEIYDRKASPEDD